MAFRITIDRTIESDPRFQKLMIKLGSRHLAKGMIWDLWTISADNLEKNNDWHISEEQFEEAEISEQVFEVGLAKKTDKGIYVKGTSDRFKWYLENRQKKIDAGKKSAESRKKKHGSAQPRASQDGASPEQDPNTPEQVFEQNGTEPNGPEPSTSCSFSSSNSSSVKTPYSPPGDDPEYIQALDSFRKGVEEHTGVRIIPGANAAKRFHDEIAKKNRHANIKTAIHNYLAMLRHEKERTPKKSFETFIGSKRSGFYWEQWLEWEAPKNSENVLSFEERSLKALEEGR